MYHILPTTAPTAYNTDNVSQLEQINVQYATCPNITRISELDVTSARRKVKGDLTSPVVFKVVQFGPLATAPLPLDALVHDTKDEAEVHSLVTAFAFTLEPNTVQTIFGGETNSRQAYFRNITVFSLTTNQFQGTHLTLHYNTVNLHKINQLCLKNTTNKYMTVKLMKTVSIDRYNKARFTSPVVNM
jgi:hypothetical protein